MKTIFRFLIYFVISIIFVHCARKGRPDGGPKDETAPIMVRTRLQPWQMPTCFKIHEHVLSIKSNMTNYSATVSPTINTIEHPPFGVASTGPAIVLAYQDASWCPLFHCMVVESTRSSMRDIL